MTNGKSGTQRLRDPEVLLSILDNLPTSIFVKDKDLKFVYSNRIHCDMIGKPESELLGFSDADFYDAESAVGFLSRDRDVVISGNVSTVEEMASRQDGMSMSVLTRKARLAGPDGSTYLIGTNSDLTEIRKREEQHRALAQTVPIGVLQIEENGNVTFANPLALAYIGMADKPESGSIICGLIGGSRSDFPGVAAKFETDVQAGSGQPRRVLVISSGWLVLGDSKTRSAIISIVDLSEMTELRRINDEVSRLNSELAANVKRMNDLQDELVKKGRMEQLGQLTATVAHELRNPLGAVRTSTFLLERKLAGKDHGVEVQLQRITNGILRCDSIITQLLDFSRNKLVACKPGNIDQWLQQVLTEESARLGSTVKIESQFGIGDKEIPFDPQRMVRAVINLLSNAAEAMVGKGDDIPIGNQKPPTIRVATGGVAGRVFIRVTDNGPGMNADILAKVREPLFTTKSFGTGLGIPAIEQIAVQHGGSLDIESTPGAGATFTLWLPCTETMSAAA